MFSAANWSVRCAERYPFAASSAPKKGRRDAPWAHASLARLAFPYDGRWSGGFYPHPGALRVVVESSSVHIPVLADEVLSALDPQPGQALADGTLGGGGPGGSWQEIGT